MLLSVKGVGKRFGHVEALREVSFDLEAGEVLALAGDNGSGKSTLIRILSGLFPPTTGRVTWEGRAVELRSPREAQALGISTVYQDLAVVELMSIARNLFLGREHAIMRGRWPVRWLDRGLARRKAVEAMAGLGIEVRDADELVGDLSGGERQSIAIARGVLFSAKLLILDEPTAALSLRQTERVLASVRAARERGLAVVIVAHNVQQLASVADQYVVLSRGRVAGRLEAAPDSAARVSELLMRVGDPERTVPADRLTS